MPNIDFDYTIITDKRSKRFSYLSLSKTDFKSFNSTVLGLGDISKTGGYLQTLSCFYDLEGFTAFSNQIDSHLVVPEFLKRFTDWLFESLAKSFKAGQSQNRVKIWGSLPFFAKFLGDGILFLWNTERSGGFSGISNIIIQLSEICLAYQNEFLLEIRKHVSNPPEKLRCGVARGQVISIGDGADYVGSCINVASRLQKLSNLTFAISRRGLDLYGLPGQPYWKDFDLKKLELRGIGTEELVYIRRSEFQGLAPEERVIFREP